MISWIQRYFQRHFKLVILLILLAMGVPMIFIYSQSSGIGHASPQARRQMFFGKNLSAEADAGRIFGDADRSVLLKMGYAGLQGAQREQYALSRVAGLALADQLQLPVPTKEQVSAYVAKLPIFQNEQGQFDTLRYAQFGDSLKNNPQFSTADANRILRDDTRLEQLQALIGGPGYVLPSEVRDQLSRGDTAWTVQVASLDYATYNPGVTATDDAVAKFFEENSFRYLVPDQIRATMIEFTAVEYTPPGNPTEEQLRAFYDQNPARFPPPPDDNKAPAAPALSLDALSAAAPSPADLFAKVRPQVEAAFREAVGLTQASKAANDFTIALYERKAAPNSPELASFLGAFGKRGIALPAFAPDSPPATHAWLGGSAEELSRLGRDSKRYFSDPIRTPTGFAVLLWNETLPSYKPMLTQVREKVAADYLEDAKRKRFIERGNALQTQLQAAVKAGTAFEKAAADAKLEVKSYAGFTVRQPPQDFPYQVMAGIQNLAVGDVAPMTASADKGLIAFVQAKKLPDLAPDTPRFAEVRAEIMRYNAASTQSSYLSDLIEAELKKSSPPATP